MHELFQVLQRHAGNAGGGTAFDDGTTRLDHAGLARRVAGAAEALRQIAPSPVVVGLLGGNDTALVVAQLACWHAGLVAVPLPPFFSAPQLQHILRDAGVGLVLCTADMAERARGLGVPTACLAPREAAFAPPAIPSGGPTGGQIIYTSGSTGQPKGVLLTGAQMMWSTKSIATAIAARPDDSYLSAVPLALLLETLCAVTVPILAGAPVRLDAALAAGFAEGGAGALADSVARHRPSCLVLVPHLLAGWVAALHGAAALAPDSLRFVAVGGAAVPGALAERAWQLGIPVHEGYGLSECGSVVALNRPGERRAGTVGRPLPGLDVRIEEGEIVVRGPSVMERYLHGASTGGVWRTGDVGVLDGEGNLTVHGRRDNLLVTPLGRNISPEWIEAMLLGDPRIAFAVVTLDGGAHPAVLLVPSRRGEVWFAAAKPTDIAGLIATCCREAPAYAVPRRHALLSAGELVQRGLLTGNGRIRRQAILDSVAELLAADVIPAPIA